MKGPYPSLLAPHCQFPKCRVMFHSSLCPPGPAQVPDMQEVLSAGWSVGRGPEPHTSTVYLGEGCEIK